MNDDLSDEAFSDWYASVTHCGPVTAKMGWTEARRRAEEMLSALDLETEATIEQLEQRERQAFEAGFVFRNQRNWNAVEAWDYYQNK